MGRATRHLALPVSAALATWLKRCWTPSGHVSLVPLLLAAGADPSTANVRGVFPLGAAASRGCVETVSALLAASADITACDLNGTRPLALAAFCGNTDVTRELIAATRAAGIDVDHRDGSGATALWLAASAGHDADVELLLGAGAAKDAANGGAVTALSYEVASDVSRDTGDPGELSYEVAGDVSTDTGDQ